MFNQYTFYSLRLSVRGTAVSLSSAKTSLTQAESCHHVCGSKHSHTFHCWKKFADSYHKFPFLKHQNPVWFFNLQPISVSKCDLLVCDSHSAPLMSLSIGGWNLVWEIWAHHPNWYPTGYYGCLLIGWWSVDWLIAWKVKLWTWWARQQTQVNPGESSCSWMTEKDLWWQKYQILQRFDYFLCSTPLKVAWMENMHEQRRQFSMIRWTRCFQSLPLWAHPQAKRVCCSPGILCFYLEAYQFWNNRSHNLLALGNWTGISRSPTTLTEDPQHEEPSQTT